MADGSIVIDTKMDSKEVIKQLDKLGYKMKEVGESGSKSSAILSKMGSGLATLGKASLGVITALGVGAVAIGKKALDTYADYEQLVGGVDTLFKDSSQTVQNYAENAYKTAGMSANEYMETVTGFSASLLQSLGGDTQKVAEVSDMAITDMSDNANKMGTSMESIKNAYQGFAKQNYTMLDNLKLGYGGTKEEMQRLLSDAEKLSGVKYDISNLNDVYQAIHVVQTELGITGTTSKEASTTISGSVTSMKASFSNLLRGIADDNANFEQLTSNFVDSVVTMGKNILPRVKTIIQGIGKLFEGLVKDLLPPILNEIPSLISDLLPMLITSAQGIITALSSVIPPLITTFMNAIPQIINTLMTILPMLLNVAFQMINTIGLGITQNLPTLIPKALELVITLCDNIISNLPTLIDTGINMLIALVQGIVNSLPLIIQEVPRIINTFCDVIYSKLPDILKMAWEIIKTLVTGLIENIPLLVKNIPQIIKAMINVFTMYNWWNLGSSLIEWIKGGISSMGGSIVNVAKNLASNVLQGIKNFFTGGNGIGSNLVSRLISGISSMISSIVGVARSLASSVINSFTSLFSSNTLVSVGQNLIRGLWNGISNMTGWIINLIGGFKDSVVGSIKSFFGIHSPSRLMRDLIGKNIVRGIGVGIEVETPNLEDDIDNNLSGLVHKMEDTVNYETSSIGATKGTRVASANGTVTNNDNGVTQNITIVNPERTPSENARAIKRVGRELLSV